MPSSEDFGWVIWPAGAGRKQVGLCFTGGDPDVIFEVSTEQAETLDRIFSTGAQVAELTTERDRLLLQSAEVLKTAARSLLAEADAYSRKWCQDPGASAWDKGYAVGVEAAAHTVANSIDRPERLTEPTSRVWALPEIPASVTAVRDREGFVWRRESQVTVDGVILWRRSTGAWTDNEVRMIANVGPLTEVRDETKDAADGQQ